ncbi:hypothetical protein CRUP_011871, partial [Coryphaenoides rupestris]
RSYAVQTPAATVSLGDLLLLRLEKDPFLLLPEDQWFCTTIVVTTPQDQVVLFPCHRWISRGQQVELRGGPDYCVEHWKDDAFYGSQFLNGVNPNIIQRCSQLPPNFPVSEDMVKPFLQPDSSLQTEMKMYIKNADTVHFHNVSHLLNIHFLVEGFALATLRNLPLIHPLYKSTIGIVGSMELFARSHAATTYESLCLPESIAARGLRSVPNFYYREDGVKLWTIIHSFVKGMVESYYPSDEDVIRDSELQAWIAEIFTNTFLEKASSGIPREFRDVDDLTKFVTMVMFRTSGHHAAVHHGQVPLGQYPSEHFGEASSKQMIKVFQGELSYLSEEITKRNSELVLPYLYLNPAQIENSVAQ